MRWARKRPCRVQAWQLGRGTEMEARLEARGAILPRPDGRYELFSQEATGEVGQIARAGDYFKVDSTGRPYPNSRERFERTHRHLEGDWYEQISPPVRVWTAADGPCEPMDYLIGKGHVALRPENPGAYFSAALWGTVETAARDAVVVFYDIARDADGRIDAIDFNFVERSEFDRTYELVDAGEGDELT